MFHQEPSRFEDPISQITNQLAGAHQKAIDIDLVNAL